MEMRIHILLHVLYCELLFHQHAPRSAFFVLILLLTHITTHLQSTNQRCPLRRVLIPYAIWLMLAFFLTADHVLTDDTPSSTKKEVRAGDYRDGNTRLHDPD